MRTNKIIVSFGIAIVLLLNVTFVKANSDSSKVFFQQAFSEVKDMLDGKQPINFERALFVTENAYWDNEIEYKAFQAALDANIYLIKQLMEANNKESTRNFKTIIDPTKTKFDVANLRFTESEKKEFYRKTLANWAIYTYITDTTAFSGVFHFPFTYQINDPFGMNDWKTSQVVNLLSSVEQKGNCFALTSLFKILSDRLNSEAYICTAPQHIYIQHRDHKGDFYNVELATGTHPGDGTLQTLTYTYYEGFVSGIALRRLTEEKQNIALCLVNLGKSYEHKFNTKDDDFILQCAELALKHDSLNLNAMLLKEQVLEERVIKYATQKNVSDINKLKLDKKIASTYNAIEKQIIHLNSLGYHQMPLYMQQMVLDGLKRKENEKIIVQDRTPNPFASLNVDEQDKRYSTLSHGLFEEVHEKKQFEQYGRFTIDTDKKKIVKLDDESNFQTLIDPVVFAWCIDPLTAKYPSWSPYAAFNDNPVLYVDPKGDDSRVSIIPNKEGGGIIKITTVAQLYGQNAEAFKSSAEKIWSGLNKESSYTDENGNKWAVQFDVTFKVNQALSEVDKNKSGVYYEDVKNVSGVQAGDNFICTDCLPVEGALEQATLGFSKTIAPSIGGVIHGLFHDLGFADNYKSKGDVLSREIPDHIDQQHFDNAAKTILGERKSLEIFPSEFKKNEKGEEQQLFQKVNMDNNEYTKKK